MTETNKCYECGKEEISGSILDVAASLFSSLQIMRLYCRKCLKKEIKKKEKAAKAKAKKI